MTDIIQISLRSSQLFWTLLCTALISDVIASSFAGNSSPVNFAIFVCVLSWITCISGMVPALNEKFLIPMVILVLDVVATLLTLVSGAVLAATLQVQSCGNKRYIQSNNLINGFNNSAKICHELQAATVFMWFLFISMLGSLIMDITNGKKDAVADQGGSRESAPTMSQP